MKGSLLVSCAVNEKDIVLHMEVVPKFSEGILGKIGYCGGK